MSKEKDLYATLYQVRTLFNTMARFIDRLHEDRGLTASERAILEALLGKELTVPEIARARHVTRQHVQMIVNRLHEKALVELRENPAHKRSALVAHTSKGTTLFDEIHQAEESHLKKISASLDQKDLTITLQVLNDLQEQFQKRV